MFDIKWIRDNPEAFDAGMKRRGLEGQSQEILAADAERRKAQTEAQDVQAERNKIAKQIGALKAKGEDASAIIEEVAKSKQRQAELEEQSKILSDKVDELLSVLPNIPADDVPDGGGEDDNVELRKWGSIREFDFEPKQHFEIGESLGMMDFETAAKISGSRFVVLSGALARLERALANFMLDMHTGEFGFTEVNPPALVRDTSLYGTGQLPKFADDLFKTEQGHWMIPTAEVPLTNIVRETIIANDYLPRRYTAMTWCFRAEAGAAGKDTRGMIRQHQFTKVELVAVTTPETSETEHEHMVGCAEAILKALQLPYRVVSLCTGDLGFSARKTYDIEVWLPGQDTYREISSVSNCGEFQARRMMARYRPEGEKGTRFVHTLNGSGLAVGRTLVAVLENYQQNDGSVLIPDALKPYMGGLEVIEPNV